MIQGAREVFVVEEGFDRLTPVQWGYPTVTLLGSHLNHELVSDLADAKRIFSVTLGSRARIVPPLPNAKDVNELAQSKNGRAIFGRRLGMAESSRR